MKVLILGAKGMLGSMLRQVLGDWDITAWDREELDITSEADVRRRVIQLQPEIIINAAAWTDVDGAEDPNNRKKVFAVNEKAVRFLAQAAKEIGTTLVHYSTDYVFPGDKKTGYSEDDPPGPAVNVYGQSKLAGERALKEVGEKFYLVRSAWLYGPGGKNFVEKMLELGRTKTSLEVVSDQYGSPTFTNDLAQATKELLEKSYPFGVYHAVNFGETTWHDFARKIFELEKVRVEVNAVLSDQFPRAAKRPKYGILRNARGPQLRHWQAALTDYLTSKRDTVL